MGIFPNIGIKKYMEETIKFVERKSFVMTPFGRRIFIPFINDKLATRKNFAERSAINAPIQGGAADLIKNAMYDIYIYLKKMNLKLNFCCKFMMNLFSRVQKMRLKKQKKV